MQIVKVMLILVTLPTQKPCLLYTNPNAPFALAESAIREGTGAFPDASGRCLRWRMKLRDKLWSAALLKGIAASLATVIVEAAAVLSGSYKIGHDFI
jgi:hypothetical protein